jgi:hypothetical protein
MLAFVRTVVDIYVLRKQYYLHFYANNIRL